MRGHPVIRAAAIGFGLGTLWGVAARIWMRLMSTAPEFSWPGTISIVGMSAVLWTGVAVFCAARASGRSRVWALAVLPGLLLFVGQGLLLLPAFAVGSLVFARNRLLRVLGGLAIAGPAIVLWRGLRVDPETLVTMPLRAQVSLVVGYLLLGLWLAYLCSTLWRPKGVAYQSDSPDRARSSLRSDSSLEAPAGPA